MKRILLFLFLSLTLFANEKNLKSDIRAEVHMQKLVEGGYSKKAIEFSSKAIKKFPKNETILSFRAKAFYELKDFDKAKIYYIKTLEINPKNEQAANFMNLIQEQENASENKALESLFEYLNDKGMDFLLIFLAFLGGEIIARKYSKCSSIEERNLPLQYANKEKLTLEASFRFTFALKNYIDFKSILTFCSFFNLIIVFLISFSILIAFLLFLLLTDITLFSSIEFKYMSVKQLWEYSIYIFIATTFITIIVQFMMYVNHLKISSLKLDLELVQYLESLASDNRLDKLYEVIKECDSLGLKKDEVLHELLSEEASEKIKYIYKKLGKDV